MARDPVDDRTEELISMAQTGRPTEALADVDRDIAAAGDTAHPGLHFARAVALHCLGNHAAAVQAATDGVTAAMNARNETWRAALLAMHAKQLMHVADERPDPFDEAEVLRNLAEAQVALARDDDVNTCGRRAAYTNLSMAYVQLRLYELAAPVLTLLTSAVFLDDAPKEALVIFELNLATLHLTWALELVQVGQDIEAQQHFELAAGHAQKAEAAADAIGDQSEIWRHRARVFLHGALAQGPDPLVHVQAAQRSLDALAHAQPDYERSFAAPLLGLALLRAGKNADGLALIGDALLRLRPSTDPVLVAATRHAQLMLLADSGPGARAGLAYGETLARSLWRQRARRLSSAEELLRYEQLRAEHEVTARDSDIDALTGCATRRALDRRIMQLEMTRRQGDAVTCVLMLDVDNLKEVNDRHGHQVGDIVLRGIGSALTGSMRGGDLVGRFGGDEFVALLSNESGDGRAVADRILAAVRAIEWPAEVGDGARVSIGVAVTGRSRTVEAALAAADRAMYAAKRAGGDTAVVEDLTADPDE